MFSENYPIEGLEGADYNPRQITKDALGLLGESIDKIGMAKPIIVTTGELIVAGHQRTKTMRALGMTHAPVFKLEGINKTDEIRFNQLHNGTDIDDPESETKVPATPDKRGYHYVSCKEITGNLRSRNANIRNEICRLINAYGPWGGVIATQSGDVLSGQSYALACKLTNIDCLVYYVPDELADTVKFYFTKTYGEFSYEHLEKDTYIQTFAQLYRLRGEGKRQSKSPNYETQVIPNLKKHERLLDFGAGQADYAKMLRKKGYQVYPVEFFHRKGQNINAKVVHAMCRELFQTLKKDGLFDVVVCDYVMNSVDSMEDHDDVLICLNAFCKMGGRIYLSGRPLSLFEHMDKQTQVKDNRRYVEFPDGNGFSAIYRKNHWFYQKFHSVEMIHDIGSKFFGFEIEEIRKTPTSWQTTIVKRKALLNEKICASIEREFNLVWPDGKSVGMHAHAIEAWRKANAKQT